MENNQVRIDLEELDGKLATIQCSLEKLKETIQGAANMLPEFNPVNPEMVPLKTAREQLLELKKECGHLLDKPLAEAKSKCDALLQQL